MGEPTSKPEYWDIEVATLTDMLEKGMWMAHEVDHIRRQLEDRKAQIIGGLGSPTQIFWTLKVQSLDRYCRVRRDPVFGWMLDRWVVDIDCWHPVGCIESAEFLGHVRPDLIPYLRAHDMQRPGYLEEKAAKAQAIREENGKKASEKVLMAVDSLSEERIKNFVEVEKAIQTGDTVTMHGKSYEMFEKMVEAGKKAPPGPESANPGMHPLRHKRDYSEGEGEQYGEREGS